MVKWLLIALATAVALLSIGVSPLVSQGSVGMNHDMDTSVVCTVHCVSAFVDESVVPAAPFVAVAVVLAAVALFFSWIPVVVRAPVFIPPRNHQVTRTIVKRE